MQMGKLRVFRCCRPRCSPSHSGSRANYSCKCLYGSFQILCRLGDKKFGQLFPIEGGWLPTDKVFQTKLAPLQFFSLWAGVNIMIPE